MLRSVLPEMAQALDESRSVRFLETELRSLARFVKPHSQPSPDGKKFVDILAEVPLCSGEDAWILLHVEIQGRGGKENFPLRMHYYRCLLEGRYHRPVAGLALLIQPLPEDQEEGLYQWSMFRSKVLYEYPVFRLYEGDERALQESDNPFDLAHYAGMQALKQRGVDQGKLRYMKILLGELEKRHWSHEDKAFLLWFIEGIMNVKDNLVWEEWDEELERRKEEGEMYVSLMEKKGISKGRAEGWAEGLEKGLEKGMEKGMEKGRMEGKIDTARKMLAQGESDGKILYFTEITPEQLEALRRERTPSRP